MEEELKTILRANGFKAVFETLKGLIEAEYARSKADYEFLGQLVGKVEPAPAPAPAAAEAPVTEQAASAPADEAPVVAPADDTKEVSIFAEKSVKKRVVRRKE